MADPLDRAGPSRPFSAALPTNQTKTEGSEQLQHVKSATNVIFQAFRESPMSFASTESSPPMSEDSLLERVSPLPATNYKVGISPDHYEPFVNSVLETFKGAYANSLQGAEKERFQELSADEQNQQVYNWLADPGRMERNEKPRLEFRECFGNPPIVANIAVCCSDRAEDPESMKREAVFGELSKGEVGENFHLAKAGSTTIELSSKNVDKSTPIKFLRHHENFENLLADSGYVPGRTINALQSRTVVVSDADGTIWDKPQTGMGVEATNLANSAAREPIVQYLKEGGVLVLNTGNDPARTERRFLAGLQDIKEQDSKLYNEILSRVIVASAGGGSLAIFSEGEMKEITEYHHFDPKIDEDLSDLDLLYLGDDPKEVGNDFPAFQASEGRYICVAPKGANVEHIKERVQEGEVNSVKDIFTAIVNQARVNRTALRGTKSVKLFQDMNAILANTRHIGEAKRVVADTLEKVGGSRDGLNAMFHSAVKVNRPCVIDSRVIEEIAGSLPKAPDQGHQTYESLTGRIRDMQAHRGSSVANAATATVDELKEGENIASAQVSAFLGQTDFVNQSKAGEVKLRILEPGNNDQSTPMFVAYQIQELRRQVEERGGNPSNINIEVLVMGKGGHATTALFPQIGQMIPEGFSGTEEAISLGETLVKTLEKMNIDHRPVCDFAESRAGQVSIKLEKDSTNTGQNVARAVESYGQSKPDYNWCVAAPTSSLRQALTFGYQYRKSKEEPLLYDKLWSMTLPRGPEFVEKSLSDYQVTMELYATLAENARLVNYAMGPDPFIPPFTSDPEEFHGFIDQLYQDYAQLKGISLEEAKGHSTGDIQGFFAGRFAELEQAVPWSKDQSLGQEFTRASVRTMQERAPTVKRSKAAKALYDFCKKRGIDRSTLKITLALAQIFDQAAFKESPSV